MSRIPIVSVVGPTASGKTALAVEIALRHGGEVVSADSMQVYRTMDIATAKPTLEEMRGIPHYLVDCLDPGQSFSVADYAALAHEVIADIHGRGKLPILAGGTGLYVDSVLGDVQFSEIKGDPDLREELARCARENGPAALLDMLREFDPETAESLHENNLGRIIRAIEVYWLTGVTMSEHRRRSRLQPSRYRPLKFGLNYRDREKLYARINLRVDRMLEQGLLREAEEVLKCEGLSTAAQAIGCKEFVPYFKGEISLGEAVENLKRSTRRYAKRQLTWFLRDPDINWFYPDEEDMASIQKNIDAAIDNFMNL